MNTDYSPIGSKIFVEMIDDDIIDYEVGRKVAEQAGVSIAKNERMKSQVGIVKAVGPGKVNKDGDVVAVLSKVGEKVLLDRVGSTDIMLEGKRYRVCDDREVLAVIE